jgi:SpoVK/Ycf46/Vps4 family AAA+-type ATPase
LVEKTKDRIQYSSLKLWFTDTPWVIINGLQGTGKSLTAKAIASDWQLPLLKLDVGKLFGG